MKINRRRFLLSSALVGGGVLIGYSATRPSRHRRANTELAGSGESFVTSLLKIEADNTVTIYVPHSEMGQGVHTSLSMMAGVGRTLHLHSCDGKSRLLLQCPKSRRCGS